MFCTPLSMHQSVSLSICAYKTIYVSVISPSISIDGFLPYSTFVIGESWVKYVLIRLWGQKSKGNVTYTLQRRPALDAAIEFCFLLDIQ